jgi:AraC-like DNA-binding protein
MKYYTIPPPASLAGLVRFFWVLETSEGDEEAYTHRSMADGCAEMIFHYKGVFEELLPANDTKPSGISGIAGPSRQFTGFRIQEDFGIFGAYLFPFAIPRFFGIPAATISNQLPDLQTLLGQEGKDLEEKIMLAGNNSTRVNILSSFLEARLIKNNRHQPPVFSAISHIIQSKGLVRIDTLASQYYLSTRQFERAFKQYAGFTPKLYARIIRFQSALAEYGNSDKNLTTIAYDCGYYDQSHFIHDFREFSGFDPRYYFSGRAEGTEWRSN